MEQTQPYDNYRVQLGLVKPNLVIVEPRIAQVFDIPFDTIAGGQTMLFAASPSGEVLKLDRQNLRISKEPTQQPNAAVSAEDGGKLKVDAIAEKPVWVNPIPELSEDLTLVEPNSRGRKMTKPFLMKAGVDHQLGLGPNKRYATLDIRLAKSGPVVVIDDRDDLMHPFVRDKDEPDLYTLTFGRGDENGNDYTFPEAYAYEGVSRKHGKISVRLVGDKTKALAVVEDVSDKNRVQIRRLPKNN